MPKHLVALTAVVSLAASAALPVSVQPATAPSATVRPGSVQPGSVQPAPFEPVLFRAGSVHPGAWSWPVGSHAVPPVVSAPFDAPETRWGPGHRGADLAAAAGQEVRSPADGRVAFVGVVVDRPVLTIDHGDGVLTSYEPLASDLAVDSRVAAGQVIGTVADGGHCAASCLHWGLRIDGVYADPLPTVRDTRPSILLPVP
ncbi:M23 family metallopeptidase [Zhihengliuella sp.]|uniref:M23 family metallopeptidase n=1 Tax=Zhihengliuella sp. TaxID=1954483 RepID=UPI002811349A|nr:M23 family metallopeptidase [Zhihengliuella sp.]